MHFEIEYGDSTLLNTGVILQLSPDVIYIQVDTHEKWPDFNEGSSSDSAPEGWEADSIYKELVYIHHPDSTDEEFKQGVGVAIVPDTEEENKFIRKSHRAHYSSRYGPSWFLIRWPDEIDGRPSENQLASIDFKTLKEVV